MILGVIIVVLIIVVFVQRDKYNSIVYENRKLRKQVAKLKETINKEENDLNNIEKMSEREDKKLEEVIKSYENEEVQYEKEEVVRFVSKDGTIKEEKKINTHNQRNTIKSNQKNQIQEGERRNITILITGSVCVILAAIVFLASTWMFIPNVLKTVILLLLTAVFLAVSNTADKKFGLKQASKTFFYIAMAYIPICLLSISVFSLFGNYLSIYGEGKWFYFAFSTLFIAVIYYRTYKLKNNKYMLYGSVLSQLFAVISVSLIFSNDIRFICINSLIYNILLVLFTKKELFEKIYNIIPIAVTVAITVLSWSKEQTMPILLALLAINYLVLYIKEGDSFFTYMYHIILVIFGAYTIFSNNNILGNDLSYLLMGAFIIITYIVETLISFKYNKEEFVNSLTIVTIIALAMLHIECVLNESLVAPYMVSFWQLGILAITYIKSKDFGKEITSILMPIYFIATGIDIISKISGSYHLYIIFSILTFIISEFFRNKDEMLYKRCFTVSHLFIIATYFMGLLANTTVFLNNIVYSLLLCGIYLYCYFIEKNNIFKYIAYIVFNYVLLTFIKFFNISEEVFFYIPMITTSGILLLEKKYKNLKDEMSYIYFACMEAISLMLTWQLVESKNSQVALVISVIFAVIIIINNVKERKEPYNLIPLIFIMPHIFGNNFDQNVQIGIMLMSVLILTIVSEMKRQVSIYTIFSGVYLIFVAISIESTYLKEILFICFSITHFFAITPDWKEDRDKFKFLSYLSVLLLYNTVIKDLEIQTFTAISMLGYIVFTILTLKTVAANYIKKLDSIEYILFAILYLIAFIHYNNSVDGMIFGGLLVLIMMLSYMKRYGAIFMVTIITILINVILLTRQFWLAIPWWIYLLVIGGALISFAVKNEANEEKKKKNIAGVLKGIKESVDKK